MPEVNGFIVAAYVVMWVGVIAYLARLVRVTHAARERLERASRGDAGRE